MSRIPELGRPAPEDLYAILVVRRQYLGHKVAKDVPKTWLFHVKLVKERPHLCAQTCDGTGEVLFSTAIEVVRWE